MITAEDDVFSPGIYAVSSGQVVDLTADRELFESRVTQVKISFSADPEDPSLTKAQLHLDDKAVLDPISFAGSDEDMLIFSARTANGCSQEHLMSNIRVVSDYELSETEMQLLTMYLENPEIMDELGALDMGVHAQKSGHSEGASFAHDTPSLMKNLARGISGNFYDQLYICALLLVIMISVIGFAFSKTRNQNFEMI